MRKRENGELVLVEWLKVGYNWNKMIKIFGSNSFPKIKSKSVNKKFRFGGVSKSSLSEFTTSGENFSTGSCIIEHFNVPLEKRRKSKKIKDCDDERTMYRK